jgi:putative transposase
VTDVTVEDEQAPAEQWTAIEQPLREVTERARTGGLKLVGEGGLLSKLTKMVVESALEGELGDHPVYARHDPGGRDGGSFRSGRNCLMQ